MSYLVSPNTDLADWLLSLPLQTGVLAMCDHWAVEVLQICRDVGLRVPEDIAVLGVDDDEFYCQLARPALSSVILASEAIGLRAAELIDSLLGKSNKRRNLAPEILLPPVGIATRRSTDVLAIDEPNVVAAIRFIRENCNRPIDVSDVLKEVPVSRRWLERRVQDVLGITLGAEIRRVRIERAKRLLTPNETLDRGCCPAFGLHRYPTHRKLFSRRTRPDTYPIPPQCNRWLGTSRQNQCRSADPSFAFDRHFHLPLNQDILLRGSQSSIMSKTMHKRPLSTICRKTISDSCSQAM